jgi:cob(I)alamin adenosyltransferase
MEGMAKKGGPQVQIYFGEGKGKTTAALGQAFRAWGRGWRVLFVQFLKDSGDSSGEVKGAAELAGRWDTLRSRLPCSSLARPSPAERRLLKENTRTLLERAVRRISAGRYDTVVLDEVLAAWKLGLLRVKDVREALKAAEESGARLIVLTGRWAPKSLIDSADLVTEIRKVKHPYDRGEMAKKGIDY